MRIETESPSPGSRTAARTGETRTVDVTPPLPTAPLPTSPCSVVWSRGHAYVLERVLGRPRWRGMDDRGRPEELSCADLQRRGWTRTCAR
jgi:hypothetical protein